MFDDGRNSAGCQTDNGDSLNVGERLKTYEP